MDFKEEDSEQQYVIKLPTYQQNLLTALHINGDHGVYAAFDPETDIVWLIIVQMYIL